MAHAPYLILQPIINKAHDMHHASTYTKITYSTKQDHILIYKQRHMANPVLIMSIAITRNRVLGFKN